MTSIDEKLLDGPSVGYCSSSEDETEVDGTGRVMPWHSDVSAAAGGNAAPSDDGTPRTGPKGVLADFDRFQLSKSFRAALDEAKLLEVANRFSLSHKPTDGEGEEGEEGDGDKELARIRSRRVQQLRSMARGRILEVPSRLDFLSLIENESRNGTLLFIHIYSDGNEQSDQLNDALLEMGGRLDAKRAKFYKVQAKVLGTSEKFTLRALPALQVYSDEQLIGNFIQMGSVLGDDYDGIELGNFLRSHGIPLQLEANSS